jgi:hypothetical protein
MFQTQVTQAAAAEKLTGSTILNNEVVGLLPCPRLPPPVDILGSFVPRVAWVAPGLIARELGNRLGHGCEQPVYVLRFV